MASLCVCKTQHYLTCPTHCLCGRNGGYRHPDCPGPECPIHAPEHDGMYRVNADRIKFSTTPLEKIEVKFSIDEDDNKLRKYHGIIKLSEEALLEAIGIHDPKVHIKAVVMAFGNNSIKIQLASNERQIDAGGGNVINLCTVHEGNEIPVVQIEEDVEQTETLNLHNHNSSAFRHMANLNSTYVPQLGPAYVRKT